ncbi:MAG: hypothetical protein AB7K71_03110 [Polyangiaceae bacterium]
MDVLRLLRLVVRCAPASATLLGCVPELDEAPQGIVRETRVLAVSASPAEVSPGETVRLQALVAPEGAVDWSYCSARRSLTEQGPVDEGCVRGRDLEPWGSGNSIVATVPSDVCSKFGPIGPPTSNGEAAGRPVDPDPTGGYYAPLLLDTEGELSLFGLRIRCGLVGVTQAQAATFNLGYLTNESPRIHSLSLRVAGRELPFDEDLIEIEPSALVEIRVGWAQCPAEGSCGDDVCTFGEDAVGCPADCSGGARGCTGAEAYLHYDVATQSLEQRVERLRVAWYATAGRFEHATSGALGEDPATTNSWHAPSVPTKETLWIVLQDDRGGATWRQLEVRVGSEWEATKLRE